MPPETDDTGSPAEWLRYARADLALARVPLPPGGMYEQLCYHAQQAAEKAIKGVLVSRGVEFPYTHSIERLADLLPDLVPRTPALTPAQRLTEYATVSRYPPRREPVDEAEYREAIRIAEAVIAWAEEQI